MTTLACSVTDPHKRIPYILKYWSILEKVAESKPDVVYGPMQAALAASIHVDSKGGKSPNQEVFHASGKVLNKVSKAQVRYTGTV